MVTDQQLRGFGDAVRAKDNWETKILDKEKNLGGKWAVEAQLLTAEALSPQNEASEDEREVLAYLKELEAEAQRIVFLDHTPHLHLRPSQTGQKYDFSRFKEEVTRSYKFLKVSEHGICPVKLREDVGVFVTDDIVPASLHFALITELNQLAAIEPKDFHPGSGGKVQDLIHPSLYPYKLNSTPLSSGISKHDHLTHKYFSSTMHTGLENLTYSSPYAWIPSIFRVSPDGASVEIQSYINGLGPRERYPDLYKIIEQVFTVVMPLLEKTVDFEYENQETPSEKRWQERHSLRQDDPDDNRILRSEWEECTARQQEGKRKEQERYADEERRTKEQGAIERKQFEQLSNVALDDTRLGSSFAGKDLKVIIKAANYVIRPGDSYEGSWHVEGMPHERIVASAIYYYDADPSIVDQGLSLRRIRNQNNDFPETETYRHEDFSYRLVDVMKDKDDEDEEEDEDEDEDNERDYPSDWEESMYTTELHPTINLGTVPTTNIAHPTDSTSKTGRILTFPNWIQHKVTGLENSATTGGPAERKILCFFLVDDQEPAIVTDTDREGTIEHYGFSYTMKPHKVLTTADVPYQARGCNFATLHSVLPEASQRLIGRRLPAETVELIINAGDDGRFPERGGSLGMSWKAAEATRRAVMDDRRSKTEQWGVSSRYSYSLCEH